MASTTVADELRRLLDKYRRMHAIRAEAHVPSGEGSPPSREDLRRLSHEFPSVLAELDRIADELLDERRRVLEQLVSDPRFSTMAGSMASTLAELPPWVRGWLHVHDSLRGALACKRWLAGRRAITERLREQFLGDVDGLAFPDEARSWAERLDEIANPPRGRILDVVFADVARRLQLRPTDVIELLMPRPPRHRSGPDMDRT